MRADLIEHYKARAPLYESIYFRPEEDRLYEIEEMGRALRDWVRGRDVLEVAAGTGWWTVHAAATAGSVAAIDANPEMLELARQKPLAKVRFEVGDAYRLQGTEGRFDAAVACFWLSHVPRARLREFLDGLHLRLEPGARVFMADNLFDADVGGRFVSDPGSPDTYRVRSRPDGTEDLVLKNYFSKEEFAALLAGMEALDIQFGKRYWWVRYQTPGARPA